MSVWLVGSSCDKRPSMSNNIKECETIGKSRNSSARLLRVFPVMKRMWGADQL